MDRMAKLTRGNVWMLKESVRQRLLAFWILPEKKKKFIELIYQEQGNA